jgi:hypothetical protein
MFLGWVFNLINLAFVYNYFSDFPSKYKVLFWTNQALVVLMMFSFPVQGYGFITIPLSTLHTVVSGLFCYHFIRDTRSKRHLASRWFACASLIFFLISAVGPFALAPIMANGLGHTKWYYFAIYYYLHFQYNGFFTFGILSLFFNRLEKNQVSTTPAVVRRFGWILAVACVPAYFLSVLWAHPPHVFYYISAVAGVLQIIALVYLFRYFLLTKRNDRKFIPDNGSLYFVIVLSFVLKLILQLFSAHPVIAQLAYENRFYVIAYLHLVLIGVVSFYLIVWAIEEGFLQQRNKWVTVLLVAGFAGSELIMVAIPSINIIAAHSLTLIAVFSAILFAGFSGLLFKFGNLSPSTLSNQVTDVKN